MITTDDRVSAQSKMGGLADRISHGATLDDTLDYVYEQFQGLIPYDRIGFAEIDEDCQTATARWARSENNVHLRTGYSAELAKSSLSLVITHRKPRLLNDLPAYLENYPDSRSTRLMVKEGVRSSLTCPLFVGGMPTGFLFFSSNEPDAYTEEHVRLLKEVTGQLSVAILATNVLDYCKSLNDDEIDADVDDNGKPGCHYLGPGVVLRRIRRRRPMDSDEINESLKKSGRNSSGLLPNTGGLSHGALLPISALKPRMTIARPIRRKDGMLLLSEGAELSPIWINRLGTMYDAGELHDWRIMVQDY
ncbi:GAF domain-containing protein [Neorhodopirellula lusitana]|uniref:GAF domain-containing protein n=1 Tax=Neorhodopirellula lusitana TaxID=445327 RepID=UPI00384B7551